MAKRLDGTVLRELQGHPIRDALGRASWDCFMEAHHCLGFRSPFGAVLRHVAELLGGDGTASTANNFKIALLSGFRA